MLLYQLTEDKAGLYSHIAHSIAEYEWAIGVLHGSSQPRGQVGADIQATLSAKPFPCYWDCVFSEERPLYLYVLFLNDLNSVPGTV